MTEKEDIDAQAARIHEKLVREFGLSNAQAMALPTLRDMSDVLGPASALLGMFVMESTMNDADRAWMKSKPKSLGEALKGLTPPRPVHFGKDEHNAWFLMEHISSLTIGYVWAGRGENGDRHTASALQAYEHFCRILITMQKDENAPGRDRPLERLLTMLFPLSADAMPEESPAPQKLLSAPSKPKRPGKRQRKKPAPKREPK
jgi:hypothetical protein